MTRWSSSVEIFIITALISYLITPMVRTIAIKTGYLDHPKNTKIHAHPTALLGGVSIYAAFVIGLITTVDIVHQPKLLSVLIGMTFLLIVGLIDDRMGMLPEVKLLAQFLAAMIVIKSGVRIEFLHNHYLNTILTYLWIVGITNSFNLLDNMNGLSAGIAAIAAAFFGIATLLSRQYYTAPVCFALAGSALGFLRHNFPRANIFMGDTGSLVLGFVLASLAIIGSWSVGFFTTSLVMPIIILAYPIFDTTLVTLVRLAEGRSIFQGGRDHSSHRLALLGFKKKRAVLLIYSICVSLGLAALLIQRMPLKSALFVIGFIIITMLALGVRLAIVGTGRFGRNKRQKDLE